MQDKVIEAPTVKASSSAKPDRHQVDLDRNVTSMKPDDGSMVIGSDEKDQIEYNYGFSGQNIEEYSAVLEDKLELLESSAD